MNGDRAPFVRAVLDAPDDDLPRLVYADWLDEHGDPDRAEFIRVQCELATITDQGGHNYTDEEIRNGAGGDPLCGCRWDRLHRRERDLLAAGPAALPNRKAWRFDVHPEITCEFRRGFVEAVACTAADFARYAAAILAAAPLRRVALCGSERGDEFVTDGGTWPRVIRIRDGGCEVRLVAPSVASGMPARLEAGDRAVLLTNVMWRTGGRPRDLTLRGPAGQTLRVGRDELFATMTLELGGPVVSGAGIPAR